MIGLLNDEEKYVRSSAALALGRIGERAAEPLLKALDQTDKYSVKFQESIISALANIIPDPEDFLFNLMYNGQPFLKGIVMKALSNIGTRRVVEALLNELKEEPGDMDASNAIMNIRNHDAVSSLIEVLESENQIGHFEAIHALGRIRDHSAVEILFTKKLDEDYDEDLRHYAEKALEEIDMKYSVDFHE